MTKGISIFLIVASLFLPVPSLTRASEDSDENRIFAVVQRMISVVENTDSFTCETEVTYYTAGVPDEQWRLTFFFKRNKKFRVDFSYPYRWMSVFYTGGDEKLTVRPLRFIPGVKLSFSIDNPRVKTPSGQRIDQTDVAYFIRFIMKNLKVIQQRENEFREDADRITFLFWARDYIEGRYLEQYRVSVSKKNWFPTRVERYTFEGKLIEVTAFKNFVINANLDDKIFLP